MASVNVDPQQWLKALSEELRSWKIWTFLLLVTVPTLVVPRQIAALLGIETLRNQFRSLLGVATIFSIAGLVVFVAATAEARWQQRKQTKKYFAELRALSPEEKDLLATYMSQQTKTLYFDMDDGIATGLQSRGILYRPTTLGSLVDGFAFNLQPWVWNELQEHPELLQSNDQRRRASSRPH